MAVVRPHCRAVRQRLQESADPVRVAVVDVAEVWLAVERDVRLVDGVDAVLRRVSERELVQPVREAADDARMEELFVCLEGKCPLVDRIA
eukprot:scaffold41612_cov75-Phaeocystis_antarctica.AAC.6